MIKTRTKQQAYVSKSDSSEQERPSPRKSRKAWTSQVKTLLSNLNYTDDSSNVSLQQKTRNESSGKRLSRKNGNLLRVPAVRKNRTKSPVFEQNRSITSDVSKLNAVSNTHKVSPHKLKNATRTDSCEKQLDKRSSKTEMKNREQKEISKSRSEMENLDQQNKVDTVESISEISQNNEPVFRNDSKKKQTLRSIFQKMKSAMPKGKETNANKDVNNEGTQQRKRVDKPIQKTQSVSGYDVKTIKDWVAKCQLQREKNASLCAMERAEQKEKEESKAPETVATEKSVLDIATDKSSLSDESLDITISKIIARNKQPKKIGRSLKTPIVNIRYNFEVDALLKDIKALKKETLKKFKPQPKQKTPPKTPPTLVESALANDFEAEENQQGVPKRRKKRDTKRQIKVTKTEENISVIEDMLDNFHVKSKPEILEIHRRLDEGSTSEVTESQEQANDERKEKLDELDEKELYNLWLTPLLAKRKSRKEKAEREKEGQSESFEKKKKIKKKSNVKESCEKQENKTKEASVMDAFEFTYAMSKDPIFKPEGITTSIMQRMKQHKKSIQKDVDMIEKKIAEKLGIEKLVKDDTRKILSTNASSKLLLEKAPKVMKVGSIQLQDAFTQMSRSMIATNTASVHGTTSKFSVEVPIKTITCIMEEENSSKMIPSRDISAEVDTKRNTELDRRTSQIVSSINEGMKLTKEIAEQKEQLMMPSSSVFKVFSNANIWNNEITTSNTECLKNLEATKNTLIKEKSEQLTEAMEELQKRMKEIQGIKEKLHILEIEDNFSLQEKGSKSVEIEEKKDSAERTQKTTALKEQTIKGETQDESVHILFNVGKQEPVQKKKSVSEVEHASDIKETLLSDITRYQKRRESDEESSRMSALKEVEKYGSQYLLACVKDGMGAKKGRREQSESKTGEEKRDSSDEDSIFIRAKDIVRQYKKKAEERFRRLMSKQPDITETARRLCKGTWQINEAEEEKEDKESDANESITETDYSSSDEERSKPKRTAATSVGSWRSILQSDQKRQPKTMIDLKDIR